MSTIPSKVAVRLAAGLKRFQPIISSARARDVNESDTVTIITDLLAEMFGYDKYSEVTKEHAIRSTYCDLAIKIDGQAQFLIEVKAIGLDLKEVHVKQAIDYAANQGVDWVALTNGMIWKVFRVIFAKPIDMELVAEIDLLSLNAKNESHLEQLYLLSREGWVKSSLSAYYTQRQTTNKFMIAALLQNEGTLDFLRRELRRIAPDVKVKNEEIQEMLVMEVLKREVVEGEKATEAKKKLTKIMNKNAAVKVKKVAPVVTLTAETDNGPVEVEAAAELTVVVPVEPGGEGIEESGV